MRSCDQVSGDLPVEFMLNHPKCTRTTNNPTSNPTTCVDEIGSVIFNKDIHRTGTSKRKQKALLHRERKENTINTRRLEIQKVTIFTNINILVVFPLFKSGHMSAFGRMKSVSLFNSRSSVLFSKCLYGPASCVSLFNSLCSPLFLSLASAFLGAHHFLSFPVLYLLGPK
jgi:hypothetical protein